MNATAAEMPDNPSRNPFAGAGNAEMAAAVKRIGPAAAGFALPILLILYLAFQGGGYHQGVRSEVGLVVWWIVAVGCICAVLPVVKPTRQGLVALGFMFILALWTALSLIWTDSTGRTFLEIGRVATLLGVLVLATLAMGRESLRRTLLGVLFAISIVAVFALASRFEPGWFPNVQASSLLDESSNRLFYPLGYWNGLGTLCAIGIPLAVAAASRARWTLTRSVAAAAIPLLCLTIFYTYSRAGMFAAIVGGLIVLMLAPGRLAMMPNFVPGMFGAGILIVAANQRSELADSPIGTHASEGGEMLAMTLVVCLGVAFIQAAFSVAQKQDFFPSLRPSRNQTLVACALGLVFLLVVSVAINAPGRASDGWNEFRQPGSVQEIGADRLQSFSGNNREQFWDAAIDEFKSEPVTGRGSGSFEFWSNRSPETNGFVRDAHSLYLEILGELGIVGLILLLGLFGCIFGTGVWLSFSGRSEGRRQLVAGATAGFAAFAVAAGVDWSWEMTVLPVSAFLLGAAVLSPDALSRASRSESRFVGMRLNKPLLAGVVGISLACMAVTVSILGGSDLMNESHSAFGDGEPAVALEKAKDAASIQPYASEPKVQEAQILASLNDKEGALAAVQEATDLDPLNWRPWLVRAQISAQAGHVPESLKAFRTARSLNPNSLLFSQ